DGASRSVACLSPNDLESRRQGARGWAGDCGSASSRISATQRERSTAATAVGRTAAGTDEIGRRAGIFGGLETQGRARPVSGSYAATRCPGRKVGPPGKALGGLSPAGAPPLAQSRSRYPTSQSPALGAGGVEKKTLPEELATVLTAEVVRERPIRLMFQDEARFGRMARIRRCWAPAPRRPVVCNGYERQFTYVYGGVSPFQGQLGWSLSAKMNTTQMT